MAEYQHRYTMYEVASLLGISTLAVQGSHGYFDCVNPECQVKAADKKFDINFEKDKFNCFGCGKGGNPVTLYRLATGDDTVQALNHLKNGVVHVPSEITAAFNSNVKRAISEPILSDKIRTDEDKDVSYNALLSLLKLSDRHRKNLMDRGLTEEQIARDGYKSLPMIGREKIASTILEMGIDVDGIPGFYKTASGAWSVYAPSSGFLIPIRLKNGVIPALQIRQDTTNPKFKYIWFSTPKQYMGTSQTSRIHYEGLFKKGVVFIIEGALKANTSYNLCEQLGLNMEQISFLALSSVTTQSGAEQAIEEIISEGDLSTIIEAFDQDKASNQKVAVHRGKLWGHMEQACRGTHIKLLSMKPSFFFGKGLDDHLKVILDQKKLSGGLYHEFYI